MRVRLWRERKGKKGRKECAECKGKRWERKRLRRRQETIVLSFK
jgi:hypothetical protein